MTHTLSLSCLNKEVVNSLAEGDKLYIGYDTQAFTPEETKLMLTSKADVKLLPKESFYALNAALSANDTEYTSILDNTDKEKIEEIANEIKDICKALCDSALPKPITENTPTKDDSLAELLASKAEEYVVSETTLDNPMKKKRHRRTKAEMEAARRAEAEAKENEVTEESILPEPTIESISTKDDSLTESLADEVEGNAIAKEEFMVSDTCDAMDVSTNEAFLTNDADTLSEIEPAKNIQDETEAKYDILPTKKKRGRKSKEEIAIAEAVKKEEELKKSPDEIRIDIINQFCDHSKNKIIQKLDSVDREMLKDAILGSYDYYVNFKLILSTKIDKKFVDRIWPDLKPLYDKVKEIK